MSRWNVRFDVKFGSHLPVLIKVLSITAGDVAEIGTGLYSTCVLHWICSPNKRRLFSFDNDEKYLDMYNTRDYEDDYHKIIVTDDWDKIEIERQWDVVLIDHKPQERRKIEAARVANYAQYVLIHDSGWQNERHYQYSEVYPLFKYRYDYSAVWPHTTILSNFVDLAGFSI